MNLTLTLTFYPGDLDKAKNLLHWIAELGGCKRHNLLLVADSLVPVEAIKEMKKTAAPYFFDVNAITVTVIPSEYGWPTQPSRLFFKTCEYIYHHYKHPFFWLEPDAIPLKKKWLDILADEYASSPAKFMGTIMENHNQPALAPMHLNGVALYPQDAWQFYRDRVKEVMAKRIAWDIHDSLKVVAQARNSMNIQNVWGPDLLVPPVVVAEKQAGDPEHFMDMRAIWPGAVLFHRDKAQNLIPLLRERLKGGK